MKKQIILASASPSRLELLKQIGIIPDRVMPADIDETEKRNERPDHLAKRLSYEKANEIATQIDSGIIIAADTVPCAGRIIFRKARDEEDIKKMISLLENRRHQVYTGVTVIDKSPDQTTVKTRLVKTILNFRAISDRELQYYASLKEGIGKAGGYTLNGYAQSFVSFISGSHSNVIGLPLCETVKILNLY